MAYEAIVTKDAMRFAEAIHKYATSRGWKQHDYHIFMTCNMDFFILRILVVARGFDGRTERREYEDYDDVRDVIDDEVNQDDHVFNSYGLVLSGMERFALYHSPALGPSEIEIDEKLINHGVSWSEPFRRKN